MNQLKHQFRKWFHNSKNLKSNLYLISLITFLKKMKIRWSWLRTNKSQKPLLDNQILQKKNDLKHLPHNQSNNRKFKDPKVNEKLKRLTNQRFEKLRTKAVNNGQRRKILVLWSLGMMANKSKPIFQSLPKQLIEKNGRKIKALFEIPFSRKWKS